MVALQVIFEDNASLVYYVLDKENVTDMQDRFKNDVARTLTSFHRRVLSVASSHLQDPAVALHLKVNDEINHEDGMPVPTSALLKQRNMKSEKVIYAEDVLKCSSSLSREALLQKSLSVDENRNDDNDDESTVKLHHKNCLSMWKSLGSKHTQRPTKSNFHALSSSRSFCPSRGVPTLQGNSKILPEKETFIVPTWRCFTFQEITCATNSFHPENIVGKGGYGKVYKGTLEDGQIIAIKKLSQSDAEEQKEKDFLVEIGIMAHVCHPNVTPLVGFCLEGGLYLVYNFCPNGSLANLLHGTRPKILDWPSRNKVAIGAARGLQYLHKHCQRRIIHRDIKASNILLDTEFEPQISDFGLAKWLPEAWTHHSVSPIEGTYGYLAPEYYMHGIVDEKTDVYSFGVLLLEIISGRRPINDVQQSLVLWAKPLLDSRNLQELADPELRGSYDYHQMHCMMITAEMCVRQSPISRPSMSQVLELLTKYK